MKKVVLEGYEFFVRSFEFSDYGYRTFSSPKPAFYEVKLELETMVSDKQLVEMQQLIDKLLTGKATVLAT